MKTINKYILSVKDASTLYINKHAEILDIQNQRGNLTMWCLVDTDNDVIDRHFEIFGTGHEIYCDMGVERKFLATVQDGGLVWHIFERLN